MSNLIKKFNVTINGDSATYEVGADAKNVQFSDKATSPFTNETVEDNIPVGIVEKAENRIYGNAYIKNNNTNIEGRPEDFGPVDDIQTDRTNEGAGALTITYGFNSLAKGHHSTAIGFDCEAAGWASHAEGWKTATAQNTNYSHAEGAKTEANHNAAHAEGDAAKAYGYGSHAEGRGTYVYGAGSHVEGMASNIGYADKVAWQNSNALHGFDMTNNASNNDVDVELTYPKQFRNGQLSHAEGLDNTVKGSCCHAEGMYNIISSVYASTAMGEGNTINASAAVAMGYKNTLNSGSNNSLILGNNNLNPGYPNSLFLGRYCGVGAQEAQAPALVIGSGDANTRANLMTVRHPQSGVASANNRGSLWGDSLDAHFGKIFGVMDNMVDITDYEGGHYITNSQDVYYGMCFYSVAGEGAHTPRVYSQKTRIFYNWIKPAGILQIFFQPFYTSGNSFVNSGNPNGNTLRYEGYIGTASQGGAPQFGSYVDAELKNFICNNLYYTIDTSQYIHSGEGGATTVPRSWCRMDIKNLVSNVTDQTALLISCSQEIESDYHPIFQFTFYGKPQ